MAENERIFFTTSWDDGSVLDLKLLDLLNKYGIKGTFYIPKNFDLNRSKFFTYNRRLSENEIRQIAATQEVGAHTVSHKSVIEFNNEQLKEEIFGSKIFLESCTENNVSMFCFPNGIFNEESVDIVKKVGFIGARITNKFNFNLPDNVFLMGTSINCYPFPFRKIDSKRYYIRRLLDPVKNYGLDVFKFSQIWNMYSWQPFARSLFKYAFRNGNYFHLHGHSWELEKYNMWPDLENFFKFVKYFGGVKYCTNSDIVNIIISNEQKNTFC